MKMSSDGLKETNFKKGHTNIAINILTVSKSNPLNLFQGEQKGRRSVKLTRPVSCGCHGSYFNV